jgi:quercetin dioxygenase-like cupin family protein
MDGPCCMNGKTSKRKRSAPVFVLGSYSANMTFALWDIDAGASLPEYAHPHEQVVHLLEGELSWQDLAKAIAVSASRNPLSQTELDD